MRERDSDAAKCGWAELYALGAATHEERSAFEQHVQGCLTCKAALQAAAEVVAEMAGSAALRPESRAKFVERLRDPKGDPSAGILFALPGLLAKRTGEMKWQPGGLTGVWTKTLFEDKAQNYRTSLVKLDSGARYTAHRHAGVEEVYVLQGDLHFDVGVLIAGDYCSGESGTFHSASHSENGCVLLIRTSCDDELLSGSHKTGT